MFVSDPSKLQFGTRDRRCWSCDAFVEIDHLPSTAQPLGTCTRVRWMMRVGSFDVRQDVHADDVCAKHEPAFGRSIGEREEWAQAAGLG